jgi:LysR family transcriptional regulator for bpeEF and oprC
MDRLWAMQVFVKVVDAASFSGAARQLDLANASVTSAIRNLEGHLGVTLLQRTTRHLHVTEEGAAFYDRCKSILAQVEEAEGSARDAKEGLRGTLRIEAPFAIGHSVLAPVLVDFAARNPELRIVTTLTNQVDNLVERGIDLAIRMDEVEGGDLVAHPIYEGRYVVCAAPAFLRRHGTPSSPQGLRPESCLGLTGHVSTSARAWSFRKGAEEYRLWPEGNLAFNASDALIRAAMRGAGMIYVLDILVRDFVDRGELTRVLPEWETAKRTFYLVYPKSRFLAPKVKAFADFIATALAAPVRDPRKPVAVRPAGRRRGA